MSQLVDRLREQVLPPVPGFDTGALTIAQRTAYHARYSAARARLQGAMRLTDSDDLVPALLLFEQGFRLLVSAHQASAAVDASTDADTAIPRFLEFARQKGARKLAVIENTLTPAPAEPAVDSLDARELRERSVELSTAAEDLLRVMAPEPPQHKKHVRTVRNVLIATVVTASFLAIAALFVRPKNIALNKKATSSSVAFNGHPAGAVNGREYESFGFHSNDEPSPWLQIDLGRTYKLSRVRVFGRHDCCFGQSVPLLVEVAEDDSNFTIVAERDEPFDQIDPWDVQLDSVKARFVRLRRKTKGVLVVAEVEAFGTETR